LSLKARLLLLMIAMVLTIAVTLTAVQLNGLVQTWLEGARDRAEFAGQQVKTLVLQRVAEQSAAKPGATIGEAKRLWYDIVRRDQDLQFLLQKTLAQSRTIVEISVAGEDGKVIQSSNPARLNGPLPARPTVETLLNHNAWDRFREALGASGDYEMRVPLGVAEQPQPVFVVQILLSSELLRQTVTPHMRNAALGSALAVAIAITLSFVAVALVVRPLKKLDQTLDHFSQPAAAGPRPPGATTKEFAVVQSKLNLLGEQVRGAQQMIQRLDEAILLFDAQERLTLVGEPTQRLLGLPRQTLVGQALRDIFPPSTELGGALRNALQLQLPVENRTLTWERPRGGPLRLMVNVQMLPTADGESAGALVTLRDADVRRVVQNQLDLSDRLTALSRLTSGVAHEIKNPLNSINLRLEVLRQELGPENAKTSHELDIIAEEVTRLDRVVKTFLDFNRPVQLNLVDIDLGALLQEIARFVQPEAQRAGVPVNVVLEPGVFLLRGDRDLLKQALLNVIQNGLEAMEASDGGPGLRIKLEHSFSSRDGDGCVIAVSDRGPGIEPGHRDKIFQLYFTTKKGGSGIGLATAFRIAQLHGGKLEFSTEIGQGTTFLFLLPLAEPVSGPK
jgi:PAS domain S-box-containing protein